MAKERKTLPEISISAISCFKRGVDWETMKKIAPKESWQRILKDVARQVNWDEEDFGITTLNPIAERTVISQETLLKSLQSEVDKLDDNYIIFGYKRSGKRILDLLNWNNKVIIGPDNDFSALNGKEKLLFVDDDVSSGRTFNLIKEKVDNFEAIVLFDYNRTEKELQEFLGMNVKLLFPCEFFKDINSDLLMFQDYHREYSLFAAENFDLTGEQIKFQYPEWQNFENIIISLDLDGTTNIDLLKELKASYPKAIIAVNTGRDLEGAKYFFGSKGETKKEDLDKYVDYLISSNGANIYDVQNKKVVFENFNKISGIKNLLKLIKLPNCKIIHFGDGENDECFVKEGFETYAPNGSYLSNINGVKTYDSSNQN